MAFRLGYSIGAIVPTLPHTLLRQESSRVAEIKELSHVGLGGIPLG